MQSSQTLIALWPFALGLAGAGLVAGTLAGLLGVGGGIVLVPVLYHVLSALGVDEAVRMHLAVGTSFATIIPTAIRSVRAHAKRGAVDFALLRRWAPATFLGTALGTLLAGAASGWALTLIFACLVLIVSAYLAFGRETWRLGDAVPAGARSSAIAGAIGAVSAFMGIGGGTFAVPAMTLYGIPIHRAVATSAGLGIVIAIPGALGYILAGWGVQHLPPGSLGYVNLIGFLLLTPTMVIAAPFGARLAHSLPRDALRRAFALFLALTAARMFYGLFVG